MSEIFKNRIALVTGSSRGLGRSVAKALAKNGAELILAVSYTHLTLPTKA